VDALMQDFLLPPMAIENASMGAALGRFLMLARAHFGTFVLYLILRLVLEVGLTWVGAFAVLLVVGILGLGGAGTGFLLYRSLWHAGAAGMAGVLIFCILAGLVVTGVYLLCMIALYGSVTTVRQCYATIFFGSYYPELGARLEPPAPVAAGPVTAAEEPQERLEDPPVW
jgi:hypothetical protein